MTYHSEPITRRYIGHIKASQIKNPGKTFANAMTVSDSKKFLERWEKYSLDSASLKEKSRYFSTG